MPKTKLQNGNDFSGQKFYVGLDVHKKSWAVTIRSLGIEVSHFSQDPGAERLDAYLQRSFRRIIIQRMKRAFVARKPTGNYVSSE
ncbi:hypothetical protein [Mucilaginibacter rubeus]|uniref:hypothetical protein n=1 Tax=Mucilaginibacter rubeus TaxID=2027860 RepID=UPI001AA165B9|nr:hypothetical protein [Mucilaginibacter rubeus]QTE57150.1 hypothetical protein J3L23_00635 [Mucilaginibacter rubeus]